MNTRSLPILLLALSVLAPAGYAGDPGGASALPPDVQTFAKRRDVCDYFRGNEASINKKRAKELAERMKEHCAGTDRELAALKEKYKEDHCCPKQLTERT
jgi:hypothetical protein